MSYTKQVLHQNKKFIMTLVKQHSSSDMQTLQKHTIT